MMRLVLVQFPLELSLAFKALEARGSYHKVVRSQTVI